MACIALIVKDRIIINDRGAGACSPPALQPGPGCYTAAFGLSPRYRLHPRGPMSKPSSVYVFGTCLVDLLYPRVGLAAMRLIAR